MKIDYEINLSDITPSTNGTENGNYNETNFTLLEKFIKSKYDIRFNEIRSTPDLREKGSENWIELDDRLFKKIKRYVKSNSKVLEKSPREDYITIMTHTDVKTVNPVREYLEHVNQICRYNPLYDHDWIYELSKCVVVENQGKQSNWFLGKDGVYYNESQVRFDVFFRQFLIQTIYCVLDNVANENLLLLQSAEHGIGKNRFIRHLYPTPLLSYIKEGAPDLYNKDGEIDLTRYLFIFVDEFDSMSKKNTSVIKAYLSKRYINVRLPYGELNVKLPRRTSFIGACNSSDFLHDDEERRIWAFNVKKFYYEHDDQSGILGIDNINIDLVWSQAYYYYINHKERAKPYLSKELETRMKKSNTFFMYTSLEEELVEKHCKVEKDNSGKILSGGVNMTDVVDHILKKNDSLSSKLNVQQIRRYVRKHFGEYKSVRDKNNNPIKGWNITLI